MNAIQKFIEAEHKFLDLNEIDYKEYEQTIAPLRDVECVVRCIDCEYRREWFCELDGHCHSPNFYCANGKRKDDDGE